MTPELILVITALALLLVDAFAPKLPKRYLGYIGSLVVAWALTYLTTKIFQGEFSSIAPDTFWSAFNPLSPEASFVKVIILGATFCTLLMLTNFKSTLSRFVTGDARNEDGTGELYILPLIATAGMMWMVSTRDFINLFVSLELTTLSFYIMVGYLRRNVGSLEGGLKYLICGALSTGLLVMGIAWIYGTTGSFDFGAPYSVLYADINATKLLGIILVTLGLLFKIGAVPMHVWVPDVYQGAPAPITAFLSVASKAAGFCVLFHFLAPFMIVPNTGALVTALTIITILTLVVGNFGAIPQTNLKRMMGYSSISHAGYLLPFILVMNTMQNSPTASYAIYLFAYGIMTFGAFFIISLVRNQSGREDLVGFKGLGKRNPRLAAMTTIFFASLAGVPLTGGFTAKFYSFLAMIQLSNITLLLVAIISATAGFYYYFKIIRAMYWEQPEEGAPVIQVPLISGIAIAILAILTLILGILPLSFS